MIDVDGCFIFTKLISIVVPSDCFVVPFYYIFTLFVICRKGLVELFDKLERGQLTEGSSLSDHVQKMHKNR